MCLAKVYLREGNKDNLFLENVASVEITEEKLSLTTIFREKKEMTANITKIDFASSSVYLEETGN